LPEPVRHCNVCGDPLGAPLYDAGHEQALTSLCEPRGGRVRVWGCAGCGHLLGEPLPDTPGYYAHDYRILLDADDEDQIYEVRDGTVVYRTEHQVDVLRRKLALGPGTRLLDYGCAKASTPRALLRATPQLQVHLFDVSDMYRAHWEKVAPPERCAVHRTPEGWAGRFDVVTSFFALEHIPEPRESIRAIASLLADDGALYLVVPDTFGNPADLVVIDHVNHFTAPSLHRLLHDAGFRSIEVDADSHRGAFVVVARRRGPERPAPDAAETLERATALARYWSTLGERLRTEEARLADDEPVAIYGSGFYGAWIATALSRPDRVRCFLDRSPFQQGKTLFERPVVAPEALPDGVRTVFVGLNPRIARGALAGQPWLERRATRLAFLDGQPA
jgi:SAM-dependent methyltransferase